MLPNCQSLTIKAAVIKSISQIKLVYTCFAPHLFVNFVLPSSVPPQKAERNSGHDRCFCILVVWFKVIANESLNEIDAIMTKEAV